MDQPAETHATGVDTPPVTRATLVEGLHAVGVGPGTGLVVHSSLSRFGHVMGGAGTVLRALMDVLTPDGTLLMPSFNHGQPFGAAGPGYYCPTETATISGAIPDAFWRLPGVLRSLNPTHPFAAWGARAAAYVSDHHRTLTMGPDSPLGRLAADGGYALLMGVGYGANSYHHVAEMSIGAPCLGRRTRALPVRFRDGRVVEGRTWQWRSAPCPFTDQGRYPPLMAARGLERRVTVGASAWILFRLADCYDVVAGLLRAGADGYPPCSACSIRPRHAPLDVPSDWDEEIASLRPESDAWRY